MRILLVKPKPRLGPIVALHRFQFLEPIELGYLAASVPPPHDVRVLDLRLARFPLAAFRSWAYTGVDPADQLLMGPALAMPARFHGVVRRALAQTTPIGLFIAGGLVGLCTVPCSGAIYLGVLALIAREPLGTRLGYLLLYNVMFVVPLLAVLAAVANRRTLNRLAHWYVPRKGMAKAAVGLLTVALGFIILVTA